MGVLTTEKIFFQWLMNSHPVRLNHRKISFHQNFKIAKLEYLATSMRVQGLFGDAAPPCTGIETSVCCVGGFVSFSKKIANSSRVSNPECSRVGV
jgi:hypothetical protein